VTRGEDLRHQDDNEVNRKQIKSEQEKMTGARSKKKDLAKDPKLGGGPKPEILHQREEEKEKHGRRRSDLMVEGSVYVARCVEWKNRPLEKNYSKEKSFSCNPTQKNALRKTRQVTNCKKTRIRGRGAETGTADLTNQVPRRRRLFSPVAQEKGS